LHSDIIAMCHEHTTDGTACCAVRDGPEARNPALQILGTVHARALWGHPWGIEGQADNLNLWALTPAVEEVHALPDFRVTIPPIKAGRRLAGVTMSWARKDAVSLSAAGKDPARGPDRAFLAFFKRYAARNPI
jgi:hypothetical protein